MRKFYINVEISENFVQEISELFAKEKTPEQIYNIGKIGLFCCWCCQSKTTPIVLNEMTVLELSTSKKVVYMNANYW